jgi:hypothetical protein
MFSRVSGYPLVTILLFSAFIFANPAHAADKVFKLHLRAGAYCVPSDGSFDTVAGCNDVPGAFPVNTTHDLVCSEQSIPGFVYFCMGSFTASYQAYGMTFTPSISVLQMAMAQPDGSVKWSTDFDQAPTTPSSVSYAPRTVTRFTSPAPKYDASSYIVGQSALTHSNQWSVTPTLEVSGKALQ